MIREHRLKSVCHNEERGGLRNFVRMLFRQFDSSSMQPNDFRRTVIIIFLITFRANFRGNFLCHAGSTRNVFYYSHKYNIMAVHQISEH